MSTELPLANAQIVTRDEDFMGSVKVVDGIIRDIDRGGCSVRSALDLEGSYLLPGLIDLHTDNLEHHFAPRPGVNWHPLSALLSHDAQMLSAGVTTVLDSVRAGSRPAAELGDQAADRATLAKVVELIQHARGERLLRSEHFLHIRCELTSPSVVEMFSSYADNQILKLASLMDHTIGQRQFANVDKHKKSYQARFGLTDGEYESYLGSVKEKQATYSDRNRKTLVNIARQYNVPLATHDDATPAHVEEAIRDRVAIAEFPTTFEAAELSHRAGMSVLMGGPNLVLGGSHVGNVSAEALAQKGILGILSSDYVPQSSLHGAFLLHHGALSFSLCDAVATVTSNPANAVGLHDRGEIAIGKRADLVACRWTGEVPVVRSVWVAGRQLA